MEMDKSEAALSGREPAWPGMTTSTEVGNQTPRIWPLSESARSQIHSSKHITSLQGVVAALLENSLDAGANQIDVAIDFERGCCTVEDNGTGIPPREFLDDGGLAKMYSTSKRGPVARQNLIHGSDGTFLARLSAVCLLRITSQVLGQQEPATVVIHQGVTIERKTPSVHHTRLSSAFDRRGTLVEVRDLFGNMPVRVKQRALAVSTPGDEGKEFQEVKRSIVALLLTWPSPCTVKLQLAGSRARTLTLSGQHHSMSRALTAKSLGRLSGANPRFDLRDAIPILFQAGIAPPESRHSWVPLSAKSSSAVLRGMICLQAAPTKQCQFIALGVQPCSDDTGHSELFACVNRLFVNSSFGVVEDESESSAATASHVRSSRRYTSIRRGVDRHPMFFLQFQFVDQAASSALRETSRSESALNNLLDILEAAVRLWLHTHHFRPRQNKRNNLIDLRPRSAPRLDNFQAQTVLVGPNGDSPHAGLTGPGNPSALLGTAHGQVWPDPVLSPEVREADFAMWSGIRSGAVRQMGHTPQSRRSSPAPLRTGEPLDNSGGSESVWIPGQAVLVPSLQHQGAIAVGHEVVTSDDFGSIDEEALLAAVDETLATDAAREQAVVEADAEVDWVDPATGQAFKVNARTGVVVPSSARQGAAASIPQGDFRSRRRAPSRDATPVSLARRNVLSLKDQPNVGERPPSSRAREVPGFFRDWNNPVFAGQAEEPIRMIQTEELLALTNDVKGYNCRRAHGSVGVAATNMTKISKEAFQQAKVIGQVDKKFIMCKLPDLGSARSASIELGSDRLVLVDQHAASERVILEDLLLELCTIGGSSTSAAGDPRSASPNDTNDLDQFTANTKPLHFDVTAREHELLGQYRGHFAHWGIIYDLHTQTCCTEESIAPSQPSPEPSFRVRVRALPTLITERCATMPRLCIDLLRTEIWALADGLKRPLHNGTVPSAKETGLDAPPWLRRLASCPQALLDLLNSRACRSAIMFNDPLTLTECEDLVQKLGRCVFPFMCAHGRVSMVPLAGMEGFGGSHC